MSDETLVRSFELRRELVAAHAHQKRTFTSSRARSRKLAPSPINRGANVGMRLTRETEPREIGKMQADASSSRTDRDVREWTVQYLLATIRKIEPFPFARLAVRGIGCEARSITSPLPNAGSRLKRPNSRAAPRRAAPRAVCQ